MKLQAKYTAHSLNYAIKNSFFRLTVAVSITFTLVSIGLIDFTESQLFIPHLQHDFEQMIKIHEKQSGVIISQYKDTIFYRVDDQHMSELPHYLKDLDVGSHEIFHNNQAFHVLVKEDSKFRYLFEINQSDFEKMELIIVAIIILAMFLSWAVALFSGHILAKKIVGPIERLSKKINSIEQGSLSTRISDDFSDDEIGKLALFFDHYNEKINAYLTREKLFTSDVSHELRTPLMVISSTCELLIAQKNKQHKDFIYLLKIQIACQEMKNLVAIFLALARNDELNNSQQNSVDSVLTSQYQKYLPQAQAKGLKLIYNNLSDEAQYYSEEFLAIVIGNLLENALKYTLKGEITMILNNDGFTIQDTGQGIPHEIKNTVFEPFIHTQSSCSQSIGLGLSIVQRICEKKGWSVKLNSEENSGTSIDILFQPEIVYEEA